MADEKALTDFVLKAGGDVSVRMEAGEVVAHYRGQPVTVKGLTLTGGPGGWTLTLDADPAPASGASAETFTVEGQGEQPPPGAEAPPATVGRTAETPAPPRRPRR
jgi:hypothetical protein